MNKQGRTSASAFRVVQEGTVAAVRLSPAAYAMYRQVLDGKDEKSVKQSAHLERYFAEFCERNPPRLSHEKFKKEADFPDHRGRKITIWAFKPWQWRLYGAMVVVEGKRCFVGVQVDASKKQDKAKKRLLELAAKEIANLEEWEKQ